MSDTATLPPSRAAVWSAAAGAALIAFIVYANSLSNGFVYDDPTVIVLNEAAHHPLDLRTIFLTPSWFADGSPVVAYRPLTTWTFAIDWALHGDRPLAYHLANVLGHCLAAALTVLLASSCGTPLVAAALAGVFFAVHPIHTEVVANAVGRAEVRVAVFALLALLWHRQAATGRRPALREAGVVIAYGLALLSKEHAIALLVLIPLMDLMFDDGGSAGEFIRRLRGRRAAVYVALVAVTAGYLALRRVALGELIGPRNTITLWMNPVAAEPALVRVLTALKVQALAVWLLFAPLHLSADYGYRQVPVVGSPSETGAIAGIAVAVVLVVLAAVLFRRSRAAFYWLAFALVAWAPVSNFAFPIGTLFGERLLYLPSVGFCILLATLLTHRWSAGVLRAAGILIAVGLTIDWSFRSAARSLVWHDDLRLGEATVLAAPESAHAHHMLGTTYSQVGRDDAALEEYAKALKIDPKSTATLYNAGVIYQRQGKAMDALTIFRRVTDIDPEYFPAWINFASVNNSQAMFTPALDAADRAIKIRPNVPNAHVVKGFALRGLNRFPEARAEFEEALRLNPQLADGLLGLGATALDQQDFAAAASAFERLVQIVPSQDVYRGLVFSYRQSGRNDDAAKVAAKARALFPDDPFFVPEPAQPQP